MLMLVSERCGKGTSKVPYEAVVTERAQASAILDVAVVEFSSGKTEQNSSAHCGYTRQFNAELLDFIEYQRA